VSAVESLVRGIAATLPAGVRERYREEWRADLDAATDAGIRPRSIVAGALGVAMSIDREQPASSGVPAGRLAVRRLRVVLAAGTTALLMLIAMVLWGMGPDSVGGAVFLVCAYLSGAVALVALVGMLRAVFRATADSPRALGIRIWIGVGILALAGFVVLTFVMPLFGVLLSMIGMGLLAAALVLVLLRDPQTPGAPVGTGARIGISLAFCAAIVAITVVGRMHVYVWNPLARMPGMTLDEIYAALAAAREMPYPLVAEMWTGFWGIVALVFPVFAFVPHRGLRRLLTVRRLIGLGLVGIAFTAWGVTMLGFGMGMGMADTFAISGADAAPFGRLIGLAGVGCACVAVLLGLLPTRIRPVASA